MQLGIPKLISQLHFQGTYVSAAIGARDACGILEHVLL